MRRCLVQYTFLSRMKRFRQRVVEEVCEKSRESRHKLQRNSNRDDMRVDRGTHCRLPDPRTFCRQKLTEETCSSSDIRFVFLWSKKK